MTELFGIVKTNGGESAVSAKELYLFLGLDKGQWSRWYQKNILENDFVNEGIDYDTFDIVSNGNPTKDFVITIDFAKRIAMMTKTEKGEEARRYFINCEKIANGLSIPKTLSQALFLAAKQAETIEQQSEQLRLQEPKVEFAEQILSATNSLDFGTSCKAMNLPFVRNRMFEICRGLGFLMQNNQPYQNQIDNGNFTLLETSFIHPKTGDRILTTKTMITAKGQNYLIKNFKKNGFM